ncbi:MAG: sigma 54-interacting transcriptional regulator, partial [Nitrospinae bacterium]|nr:sigma 54-interacting transcriptional regulator [Nitrospinota bacterium]
FGHVKGAFTGAIQNRTGRFQLAHRGVLFLDEVSEIPIPLQSKLLRVLQEGQFEPVGDDKTRQVDVRVISATNRDLLEEVRAGRFREDLYYRLNVVSLHVPPLRQRRGDIPLLAKQFLELARGKYRLQEINLNPSALEQLQLHDWPGNIRELQNAVERAYIVCQGGPLRFDLPTKRGPRKMQDGAGIAGPDSSGEDIVPMEEIKRHEYDNVLRALEQAQWKIYGPGGAAECLGVKASTLAYRIKKLGIKKPASSDP